MDAPANSAVRGAFHHAVTRGCYAGPRGSAVVLAAEAYLHKWLRTYERCVDHVFGAERIRAQKTDRQRISGRTHGGSAPFPGFAWT